MSGKYALIIGNTEYSDSGLTQLFAPGKGIQDAGGYLFGPFLDKTIGWALGRAIGGGVGGFVMGWQLLNKGR
jgi:hypothetical protein